MRNALVVVGIGAVILGAGWWYLSRDGGQGTSDGGTKSDAPAMVEKGSTIDDVKESQGAAIGEENLVTFRCEGGTSITAVFERDIVGLTLSDGRQLVLRQAPSGSGIRYLSNDTKIEFRGQGNEGQLIEGGSTTYKACTAN